jgi:DNA-binding MarR family transcriptional regulator/GNAT superfamily N-acetyltransferase
MSIATLRDASRRLVRELGFLRGTLAGTRLPPSAIHALVEIGARGAMTAAELSALLLLEKSSVSRMLQKLVDEGEIAADAHETDGRAKRLTLTEKGRATLAGIDRFAEAQVSEALARLPATTRACVLTGIAGYADALAARRTTGPDAIAIVPGYRPGLLGAAVEMHARFYARTVGFGAPFERQVAAGMAEFAGRLDEPCNAIWSAVLGDAVVGTVAIDGQDLGQGLAHLRWFIVADGLRGAGIGRRLLAAATAFCDSQAFAETQLWTFRGLDAARRLYEAAGFVLAEEQPGRQWGEEVLEQRFVRRP